MNPSFTHTPVKEYPQKSLSALHNFGSGFNKVSIISKCGSICIACFRGIKIKRLFTQKRIGVLYNYLKFKEGRL